MKEIEIQKALAQVLDQVGCLWTATANGGKRDKRTGAGLKAQGVKPGVPDILIFCPCNDYVGVAIELKREKPRGKVSPHQQIWIEELRERGWRAEVCYGLDQALSLLKELGYLS